MGQKTSKSLIANFSILLEVFRIFITVLEGLTKIFKISITNIRDAIS